MEKTVWTELFKLFMAENRDKKIVVSDVRFLDEARAIIDLDGLIIKTVRYDPTRPVGVAFESERRLNKIPSYLEINNDYYSKEDAAKLVDNVLAKRTENKSRAWLNYAKMSIDMKNEYRYDK